MNKEYIFFFDDKNCFKVGKAGSKSQARWSSQHYSFNNGTPSSFSKSILKNKDIFIKYFDKDMHYDIKNFENLKTKDWIRKYISRVEIKLTNDSLNNNKPLFALNLLESLVQFELKPIFEG